ncbi:hypothetical protein H6800_02295 [Candidatus Nomurabacteria bacterium]|nr:hypothetical protein [Candidatus Nomurabacteria bacterium]
MEKSPKISSSPEITTDNLGLAESGSSDTQEELGTDNVVSIEGWVESPDGKGWIRDESRGLEPTGSSDAMRRSPETEKSQFDKNYDLLVNSELGVIFVDAYTEAVKQDHRLADVVIVPLDEAKYGKRSSAFARSADSEFSDSGKYEIHVRLADTEGSLKLMKDTLDRVPGLREMIAEKLYLDPAELTPAQLHVFVFLHELGHIREFMDYEGRSDELKQRQKAERSKLPLKGARTSDLMDPSTPNGKYIRDNWPAVSSAYGVDSLEDLFKMTNKAHRAMTSERAADDFASDILVIIEPQILDRLGNPDLTHYLRHPRAEQAA